MIYCTINTCRIVCENNDVNLTVKCKKIPYVKYYFHDWQVYYVEISLENKKNILHIHYNKSLINFKLNII